MTSKRLTCIVLSLVIVWAAPLRAEVTAEAVDKAVARAVNYLFAVQTAEGHWELVPTPDAKDKSGHSAKGVQWGGMSALATYALLSSGQSLQEPHVAKAVEFLKKAPPTEGTYAAAFRCLVWMHLPDSAERRQLARRDSQILLRGTMPSGLHTYHPGLPETPDMSNSQVAALGLWAADQCGVEVSNRYWEAAEKGWRATQKEDGSWSYRPKDPNPDFVATHAGLTAAGVATLFIVQENKARARADCGNHKPDVHMQKAMAWMSANAGKVIDQVFAKENRTYYGLYALERSGVAGGVKRFGQMNWYTAGAEFVLPRQQDDGSWRGMVSHATDSHVDDTSFVLLFLSYGRAPLVLHKLEHGGDAGGWNQRPRDAAHFVQWLGRQTERHLNWQTVSLEAPVEELLEAPVLYIAGDQAIEMSAEQKQRLKAFIDRGGLVVANADCGGDKFAAALRATGKELYPAYEFRELPADHPVLAGQTYKAARWKTKPAVQGLSNGVRELILLVPQADLGRAWQMRNHDSRPETHELMANIVSYATDQAGLTNRGVVRAAAGGEVKQRTKIGRLMVGPNADPEPTAWTALAPHVLAAQGLEVTAEPLAPPEAKPDPASHPLVHWTGTSEVSLSEPQRKAIVDYVNGGGTLLVDAAGGDRVFAGAVERELGLMFPGSKLETLPADHALYAGPMKVETVSYRRAARVVVGASHAPRLKQIAIAGRPAVLYSAEDLTAGVAGLNVDGIIGYTTPSARAIVGNIVIAILRR